MQAISLAKKGKSGFRLPNPAAMAIVGGIGALAIAYAVLGLTLLRWPQDYENLEAGIANANIVVSKTQTSTEELAPALTQAEARLAAIEGTFPNVVQTTPFLTQLLQLAETHRVALTNTQNRRAKDQTIGQHKYMLEPFTITAEGDLPNLLTFLGAIQNLAGYTLVTKTAQLNQGPTGASLTVDVEIYARAPATPQPVVPTATPRAGKPAR